MPHWPVEEWGGTGWDSIRQYIYLEELSQAPAPAPVAFGVNMVGPVIYTFGSEDQKTGSPAEDRVAGALVGAGILGARRRARIWRR